MPRKYDPTQLSYKADSNGYTLYYFGNAIGGAGVRPSDRSARRHWKHVHADIAMHSATAKREVEAINAGHGSDRYNFAIAAILARKD